MALEEDEQELQLASELETEEAGTIRILAVDLKRNDALLLENEVYQSCITECSG